MPPYDYLILGGGTAGCVLAARLSEDPERTVCLVEAGPDYGAVDAGGWPPEMLDPRTPPDSHDWDPGAELSMARARVIGGCSSHNACLVAIGSPADYDDWSGTARGWDFEGLEPYLYGGTEAIGTRPLDDAELGPWVRAVRDGAADAGMPRIDDFNDPETPVGAAFLPVNIRGFVRQSTAFTHLDAARERPNLTVIADTLADRVAIEDGRAVGAVAHTDGGVVELEAGRVVLSAGAYGSPLILMRSGVGPAAELAQHGIESAADLTGVGASGYFHCSGTCRMGQEDDSGAVVDAGGRVHGVEGLFVCDASIIPTIPRANTNVTTIAIAERIAEMLTTGRSQ